jgi:hypothetical protein
VVLLIGNSHFVFLGGLPRDQPVCKREVRALYEFREASPAGRKRRTGGGGKLVWLIRTPSNCGDGSVRGTVHLLVSGTLGLEPIARRVVDAMKHDGIVLGREEFIDGVPATFPVAVVIDNYDAILHDVRVQVLKADVG